MLLEVGEFCTWVEDDLNGLIDELSALTYRQSPYELDAWRSSLPQLSIILNQPGLEEFHIQLGSKSLSIEYKLPASSSWCDAVLLGRNSQRPSAVIVELKDWNLKGDRPTQRSTLVQHHGVTVSHPSDQVKGYVEYCQYFHSEVLRYNAVVAGCVFFTRSTDAGIYRGEPYTSMVSRYPVFTRSEYSDFAQYLQEYLEEPDSSFAEAFENGLYAQDRNLIRQISNLVNEDDQSVFVLLDNQRTGFELCLAKIDGLLQKKSQDEKAVIIIDGPPGSGKSVLAAKLWAALAQDDRIDGRIVMTSTSSAQKTNWKTSFERATQLGRSAHGIVLPANKYNPGLTSQWMKAMQAEGSQVVVDDWRRNLELYFQNGGENRMPDNHIWVSIVDEAHALIDPSVSGKAGVPSSGWFMPAGPQGYHIIRGSLISIFLMDTEQSYRDNETTKPASIIAFAEELGVRGENIERISLGDAQFRCGGSKEYIAWLEAMLHINGGGTFQELSWRKSSDQPNAPFTFEIVHDPESLDEILREKLKQKYSVRLAASYGRKWVTKGISNPHNLLDDQKDFYIPYIRNNVKKHWARIWNYTPNGNYDLFIQAPEGSMMERDSLSEVGCPYVVRGFDFDYLGVLWLSDLVWRTDRWQIDPEHIFESAWKNVTLPRARKEIRAGEYGYYAEELTRYLLRGYRILLSRALRGLYVWFEDPETEEYVWSWLTPE